MKDKIRHYAKLIYDEFIEWTLDYVTDEIIFETALLKLETTKGKLYTSKVDIESQLLIDEYENMETILLLFLIASIDQQENNTPFDEIEHELKNELVSFLNNIKDIKSLT